jgi:filamentous hemagglutinin family protein
MKLVWRSLFLYSFLIASLVSLFPLASVKAQIEPDNTLGTENSQVVPDIVDGVDLINGGATRGSNLFHSFREFNIDEGRGAYFANPDGIANIFSRVTGANPSNILGRLGVLGNANLFLINPNGIFFGRNASLDLRGSFFASTADSLVFDNNFEFSASDRAAPPLLTVNIPTGLRFRDNPGSINVTRDVNTNLVGLQVVPGRTLALIGGDVTLDSGFLAAPGGRIELGGLSATGTVGINNDGSLSFPNSVARGDVSLTNNAFVSVNGVGEGSIAVNARNLDIFSGSGLFAGILPNQGAISAQAGDITINATNRVRIAGEANSPSPSTILNSVGGQLVGDTAIGNAGNVIITTEILEGRGNFAIGSSTFGQGNAGKVVITASDRVSLEGLAGLGRGIASAVGQSARGSANDIIIDTRSLSLSNSALITTSTLGQGNAGNIQIKATDSISVSSNSNLQAITYTSGDSGNISIEAANADVSFDGQGSFASTSVGRGNIQGVEFVGTGQGGDITLNARNLFVSDGASVITNTFGRGNAGNVTISAGNLVSLDHSFVRSNVEVGGQGNGGDITIFTGSLTAIGGGSISASTFGQGNAGNIKITARDTVSFDGTDRTGNFPSAAFSTVEAGGVGKGGDINIAARSLSLTNGGSLNTFIRDASRTQPGGNGNAGNVKLDIRDTVTIAGISNSGIGSGIFSTVENGAQGNGGSIEFIAGLLTVTDGGQINASTRGRGNAGSIRLTADSLSLINGGQLNTNSNVENYQAGNIKLTIAKDIRLDNQALIAADTQGGQGNIELESRDLILRRQSNITTNAQGDVTGGNITINTGNLVALPREDSNITANAEESFGGRVSIAADGIFGIRFREQPTPESDITASSTLGTDFSGTVDLNTPDVDPSRGLIELPENVVDPSTQIAQNPCQRGVGSEFTVTGRGGLPPSPDRTLNSDNVRVGLVAPVPSKANTATTNINLPSVNSHTQEIVPAQGWVFNNKGEVMLTTYDPTNKGVERSRQNPATCTAR